VNYAIRLGYGVVLPEMLEGLGIGRTGGGSILNAYFFCYVALTPLAGHLCDRLGARRVIASALAVLAVGVFLLGRSETLWEACTSFAVAGAGASGIWTPILALIQRWFAPTRRGLALGLLSTGYGLGFAVMGFAVPWAVALGGWRLVWMVLAAGAMLLAAAGALLLRSDPFKEGLRPWGEGNGDAARPIPDQGRPGGMDLGAVLRDRTFWLIGASYFAVSYALYGITTFMVDYAHKQMGLPLEKASLLATVHGACQMLGVLTVLPLSDRLGRRRTLLLSNGVILASGVMILWGGGSWPVLVTAVGFMAVFYGVTFPLYGACAGDYFPRELLGTVIGAWTPFYGIGAILVHWVSGLLRDTRGVYGEAFFLDVLMAVAALLLLLPVRREGPGDPGRI